MAALDLDEIYDYIIELARRAGTPMREGFYSNKEVEHKGGRLHDIVTKFDNEIEDMLIKNLSEKYPDHKFIGEETSARGNLKPELTDAPTWIIDPIDGTINFVSGFPMTAMCIALAVNKELVIGIIYNPIMNEFYNARKGHGAFLNGKRITASKTEDISQTLISHEVIFAAIPRLRDRNIARFLNVVTKCRGIRCIGCAAIDLAYVAQGIFDGYHVDFLKPWDVAAGVVLVREAGGVVYAPDGGEFDIMKPDLVCAGNEALCRTLIELIRFEPENKS